MHCRSRPWLLHYYSPVCHSLVLDGPNGWRVPWECPVGRSPKDGFRTWGGPGASAWVALRRGALPVVGCFGTRLRRRGERRLSGVRLMSRKAALGVTHHLAVPSAPSLLGRGRRPVARGSGQRGPQSGKPYPNSGVRKSSHLAGDVECPRGRQQGYVPTCQVGPEMGKKNHHHHQKKGGKFCFNF